jgi:hypothetical protein
MSWYLYLSDNAVVDECGKKWKGDILQRSFVDSQETILHPLHTNLKKEAKNEFHFGRFFVLKMANMIHSFLVDVGDRERISSLIRVSNNISSGLNERMS